ncbi:MAG: polynucleotide adenylyltransferase PcnB [Acidobacteria bacterium]|nr:polynucleotide adenylyltransferase PcnB [Acidobacteriota bacterium]
MAEPLVVPRADHTISRQQIDPDALKVLYRLRTFDHVAYLVGGGVRDLLLNRRPKDFDIGTSAHPHQVKRIFRNCWIIGRRFRLAHVKFGPKTIEVATFRRPVPPEETKASEAAGQPPADSDQRPPIRRDNTFGTAEEDAFRRDFTINALFYDIATFSVIDYVGGLEDLRNGVIRSIGDPHERFVEDPVRMLRAVSFAARLDFRLDPPVLEAIARHKAEIANASPARMIEELYKVLRSGVSARIYRSLLEQGLLAHIAPEIDQGASAALWKSLDALDAYRSRFDDAPARLTNAVLLGSLAAPVQPIDLTPRRKDDPKRDEGGVTLGRLPVARRDMERLRQLLALQQKLTNPRLPPRQQRMVLHRGAFADALTWLEMHGADAEALGRWHALAGGGDGDAESPGRRRRRRSRRGRRRRSGPAAQ